MTTTSTEGLKGSYLILDEAIPFRDAFRILGRFVANVRCPLQEYIPSQVIPGAEIPGMDNTSTMLASNYDALTRQSTSASDVSIASSSSSDSSGASSSRTLIDNEVSEDEAGFARELEKYKTTLVFSNLPFTISSSTTATVTQKSQCTTRINSFLTALLKISFSSSTTTTTTYRLDTDLIHTLSLTQHYLVLAALLKGGYKKDVMTAVQRNGGKMFLVVGVKIARNAEVQKEVSRGRVLSGGVRVDPGSGVGLGEVASMGVRGGMTSEVVGEGGRKERLLGARAFAIEYREVKLKLKLEMGSKRKEDKCGREKARNSSTRDIDIAELQKKFQELSIRQETMMTPQLLQAFSLPITNAEVGNFEPQSPRSSVTKSEGADEYWEVLRAVEEMSGRNYADEHHTDTDDGDDDGDEYELELGEEVYMQETDALW